MSETSVSKKTQETAAAFATADRESPFGPSFFLGHLGRFVRDHCPDPEEHLPLVQIRLADGETLDLCHIIGVSPRWVVLAVRDIASHRNEMAVEIASFDMIRGVRISARPPESGAVGFAQSRPPAVLSAETLAQGALSGR